MENSKLPLNPVYKYVRGNWKEFHLDVESSEPQKIQLSEYSLKDLNSKSVIELQDLLNRQRKILVNKNFLSKLPDNGERLRARYHEIANALLTKSSSSSKANVQYMLHSNLEINGIEWSKNFPAPSGCSAITESLNLDEDTVDPLELLATHSQEFPRKKPQREEEIDFGLAVARELSQLEFEDTKSLLSSENCANVSEEQTGNNANMSSDLSTSSHSTSDYYSERISEGDFSTKILHSVELKEARAKCREHFKPFRTLRSRKEVKPKDLSASSLWMESSATGPLKSFNATPIKLVPIQESLKLMAEAQRTEREYLLRGTERALADYPEIKIGLPSSNVLHYRDANYSRHILDEFDEDYDEAELSIPLHEDDEDGDCCE